MAADPKQRRDLSVARGEVRLIETLREFSRARSRYKVEPQPREFDDGVRRQLRSRGYIE